jgi:hypothetical protein
MTITNNNHVFFALHGHFSHSWYEIASEIAREITPNREKRLSHGTLEPIRIAEKYLTEVFLNQ